MQQPPAHHAHNMPLPESNVIPAESPSSSQLAHPGGWIRSAAAPWVILAALFIIFTARWIWIAGITGDYAWAYETGSRILRGQVPYRDYVCSLPPLMPYTLACFIALFKGSLWAWGIHLYLWWLASLVVGLLVLKRLGASPSLQSAAIFLTATVSAPACWTGVAHDYAAAAVFGGTLLCLMRFQARCTPGLAALAGVCVSLNVLAKQNVGAAAFLVSVLTILETCVRLGQNKAAVKYLTWFALGCAVSFLPVLTYFALHAGWMETIRQMALDGGSGKGWVRMVLNFVPIFYLESHIPHHKIWDLLVTLGFNGFMLVGLLYRVFRAGKAAPAAEETRGTDLRWLWIGLGLIVAVSLATLVPWPQVKSALVDFSLRFSHTRFGFFYYATLLLGSLICLAHAVLYRRFSRALVISWLLILILAYALSATDSSLFAAPLAIPLAFWVLNEYNLVRGVWRFAVLVSGVLLLLWAFLPQWTFAPSFERLNLLPAGTPFAHLYGRDSYARKVSQMNEHVTSAIKGHRTLWLTLAGPHSAFGGEPVKGVALICWDTYGLRHEPLFQAEWEQTPPDYVVLQDKIPSRRGSRFLTSECMSSWLAARYQKVWREDTLELTLWKYKEN